jgi:hypothetical protein
MDSEKEIVNRVVSSGLITFDLEAYHKPGRRVQIDIADQLFQGMILREKDFREFIRATHWSGYKDSFVAIYCSADAVIPTWAYMLLASALQPFAKEIVFGDLNALEEKIFSDALSNVDWNQFAGAKVVIKGCSKVNVPAGVYMEATRNLRPYAASIMFGEPCSTVPVFKRAKS